MIYKATVLLILLIIVGCKDTGLDKGKFIADPRKPTFNNMAMDIALKSRTDTIITLTTSCLPLFNGRGKIMLIGAINSENACYELMSPIQRKICNSNGYTPYDSIPFIAFSVFSVDWIIKINKQKNYTFSTEAVFDSIIIRDSCDLFVPEYDCKTALTEYRNELKHNPLRAKSNSINFPN